MLERRRVERFKMRVPAKIADAGKRRANEALNLMTRDICAGGAFFHTDRSLPEGAKVRIELVLPLGGLRKLIPEYDHVNIRVTGKVVRREPEGMAISFNRGCSIRPHRGCGRLADQPQESAARTATGRAPV